MMGAVKKKPKPLTTTETVKKTPWEALFSLSTGLTGDTDLDHV